MKSKIKKILFLIAAIFVIPFKVSAANMDSYVTWNLDMSVFAHQYRNGSEHITNLANFTVNGRTAYCIEPGITADKDSYYFSTSNIGETPLGNIDTKKLILIGYYGYGYKEHNSKEYYMATQELIWRLRGVENVWWTDQKYGGNTYNLEGYKNEIMSLVNAYEKAPIFDFKGEYLIGDTITLEDKNNILSEYEVVENSNVTINGNKIKIKVLEGDNTFKLRRKTNGNNIKYFYKSGYQTIGSFESTYNYEQSYKIKGINGKIIVDKFDFDTKTKETISSEASLNDAKYSLYDKDKNLIKIVNTNLDGKAVFENLTSGTYYVEESKASPGYTVDTKVYEVNLDSTKMIETISSYEKIIQNKIVITKVLDDVYNATTSLEEGILFGIYDLDGNHIISNFTDSNGKLVFVLNYGTYILKQETTFDGIDKVDDTIITVSENNLTQNIFLTNHPIKKFTYKSYRSKLKYLPNTGKNEIYNLLAILFICMIGFKYEKKITV